MTEKEVLNIFKSHSALLTGHFKLSSGLHSGEYLQCAMVLQYPDVAEKLARELVRKFYKKGKTREDKGKIRGNKGKIDVVIGPALGGITLAYEVARALNVRGIFTERQDGNMVLRRGFTIKEGERVLVVEDVVTTGASTKEVIEAVKAGGGAVVGVGCVIDRSREKIDFGAPLISLARVKAEVYPEGSCPLCKSNIPIVKPGSRK